MSTPERRAALTWFSHGYYNAFRSNRIGWAKEPALAPATCPRVGTARKSAPLPTRKRSGFIGTCCNSKLSFARRKDSARAHQCISTKRGRSLKSFGSGKPAKAAVESPKGQMPGLTRNFQQQTVGKATSELVFAAIIRGRILAHHWSSRISLFHEASAVPVAPSWTPAFSAPL